MADMLIQGIPREFYIKSRIVTNENEEKIL